ncbi:MAG: PAS domain-containing protein [Acetobacteraceae bacterium]
MSPLGFVLSGGIVLAWIGTLWLLSVTLGPVRLAAGDPGSSVVVVLLFTTILTACLSGMLLLDRSVRKARQATARAEQMRDVLAAALNAFPAGLQIKDAALRYVWVNDIHQSAIQHSANHLLGRTVEELGLDDTLVRQVMADDRQVLESGRPHGPVEQWVPGPDGVLRNKILVTKAPLIQDGKVTHVLTFAVEMPAWRERRLHLEEAQRLLQTVMDAAPVTIQVVDRDMRLRWANRAFLDTFGIRDDTPTEKTIAQLAATYPVSPQSIAFNEDLLSGRRDVVQTEQYYPARDGTPERHFLVLKVPVPGPTGAVEQILTIGTDVTALRRAEAKAEQANRLLESILDNVPLSIQLKDANLQYRWANRWFAQAMGIASADIPGKTVEAMNFTPEAKRRLEDMDRSVLSTGETIRFDDHWLNDGVEHVMSVIKAPILDADGRASHVLTIADDVTEQHRLRAEADTANRLVEGILRHVPLSIQIKDRDLRYRWANRAFAQTFNDDIANMIGKTVHDLNVPTWAMTYTDEQDRTVLTTCATLQFQERWVHDGVYRQVMVVKAPMVDADGVPTHVITIGADVSELYRLRTEADEARRRLQQVLDAVPLTIALKDRDRRYQWVNREFERILGKIVAAKIVGARVEEFLPDHALAEEVRKSDEALLETGVEVPAMAQRLPAQDGQLRDYSVRRVAVRDAEGRIEGILAVGVDVTDMLRITDELREVNSDLERRAAERARELAKVNELVSTVLDCAPVPIITMALDGRFTSWNPAAERLLGLTAEEALTGRAPARSPRQLADLTEVLSRITRGESFANMEIRRRRKEGGEIELLMSGAPLRNPDGIVEGAVIICLDVTQQRATARQLQQAQKMEAVGQLTGGIAHDFNNLLAVIIGSLDLLLASLTPDEAHRSLVDQAIEAAEKGADLTSRLLAFARRQALRPTPTNIDTLVHEMTPLLQRAVGDAVAIRRTRDDDLWPALVDRAQLESAILNLALNARDAMPSGGTLTIDTCNAHINEIEASQLRDIQAGDYVCITVSDNGSGIPPDVQPRVFEPFFTTKEVGKGSGLGLSMVLGFANQSGGRVSLTSFPGNGTSVALYLPRADDEAGALRERRSGAVAGNSELILLVEDDPRLRKITAAAVKALGYRVIAVGDARTAMQALAANPEVKLLFSDVILGGGSSGFDLAREAKRQHPDLRILFVSGFADPEDAARDDFAGAFDMLRKPFRRVELAAKLHACLGAPVGVTVRAPGC